MGSNGSATKRMLQVVALLGSLALLTGCGSNDATSAGKSASSGKPTVVVTYSVLGSIVKALVDGEATVEVMIPNGSDPHEWEPSAKDIARLNRATVIVRNGLDLEAGMAEALDAAKTQGVRTFFASDHIQVRRVGNGEGLPNGDPDQAEGAEDPHLWTDPLTILEVVTALAPMLNEAGIDVSGALPKVEKSLRDLDETIAKIFSGLPAERRKLVTGHESLGYFAQRYNFTLVGAVVESLTSEAEVSSADLAKLKTAIEREKVPAIFTELGTPKKVADAIGKETGARVVALDTHKIPKDGTYTTYLTTLAKTVAEALQ